MSDRTKPELHELVDYRLSETRNLRSPDLNHLEDAILIRRHQIMAERLKANGFHTQLYARTSSNPFWFSYVLVYLPNGKTPAVFATLGECTRLLDTVRNLPADEAFNRWQAKVQPLEQEEYTEHDARRDTRDARQQLRDALTNGEITSREFADAYRTTSFMDLAAAQDQVAASETGKVWGTVEGEHMVLYEGSLSACHDFAATMRDNPTAAGLQVVGDGDAFVEAQAPPGDPLAAQEVWSR